MQKSESISNIVVLAAANSNWKAEFLTEAQRIRSIAKMDLAIEHIGSTSIPNMRAKPTIDILIGASTKAELNSVLATLVNLGYVLEGRRNNDQHSWLSYPTSDKRKYIIHLVINNDDEWEKRINFRDYLISHTDVAEKYKKLKIQLAEKYPSDLNMYTAGKAAFVSDILEAASKTGKS